MLPGRFPRGIAVSGAVLGGIPLCRGLWGTFFDVVTRNTDCIRHKTFRWGDVHVEKRWHALLVSAMLLLGLGKILPAA